MATKTGHDCGGRYGDWVIFTTIGLDEAPAELRVTYRFRSSRGVCERTLTVAQVSTTVPAEFPRATDEQTLSCGPFSLYSDAQGQPTLACEVGRKVRTMRGATLADFLAAVAALTAGRSPSEIFDEF